MQDDELIATDAQPANHHEETLDHILDRLSQQTENDADTEPFPLSHKYFGLYDRPTLIRRLDEALSDNSWKPTVYDIEALLCVNLRDLHTQPYRELRSIKISFPSNDPNFDQSVMPWPRGTAHEGPQITDGKGYDDATSGLLHLHDKTVHDEASYLLGGNELTKIIALLTQKLDPSERVILSKYILSNSDQFVELLFDQDNLTQELFKLIDAGIDPHTPEAIEIGRALADFALAKYDERAFRIEPVGEYNARADNYAYQLTREPITTLVLRGLATGTYDEDDQHKIIGMLSRKRSIPHVLNRVRNIVFDDTYDKVERDRLNTTLHSLLNILIDLPAHRNVEDFYKAFAFEKYPVGEHTRTVRMDFMKRMLEKYEIPQDAHIYDVGSGTGWLVGGLHEMGYNNSRGIDGSEKNKQIAVETYGDYFEKGDWNKLPLGDNTQDVTLSLGRSLPHTEERIIFEHVIKQLARVTKVGGTVIIDMPDPTKGSYKANIDKYREAMRAFGYTDAELEKSWYVVDTPDGINYCNRFVPSREVIKSYLIQAGLEVVEEIDEEISNHMDDTNMVFVCRKKPLLSENILFRHSLNNELLQISKGDKETFDITPAELQRFNPIQFYSFLDMLFSTRNTDIMSQYIDAILDEYPRVMLEARHSTIAVSHEPSVRQSIADMTSTILSTLLVKHEMDDERYKSIVKRGMENMKTDDFKTKYDSIRLATIATKVDNTHRDDGRYLGLENELMEVISQAVLEPHMYKNIDNSQYKYAYALLKRSAKDLGKDWLKQCYNEVMKRTEEDLQRNGIQQLFSHFI